MVANQLDKNIAANLKRIRKSKNMSLDMLAEKTGVSKSMLGQIERGESNPTVATIAKIVDGIRIPFEDLIYPISEKVEVIDQSLLPVLKAEKGVYEIKSIFPYDRQRNFEVYELSIEPGESCKRFLPEDSIFEYIMVNQGELTLQTPQGCYQVDASHALKISVGSEYTYMNHSDEKLVFHIFAATA